MTTGGPGEPPARTAGLHSAYGYRLPAPILSLLGSVSAQELVPLHYG